MTFRAIARRSSSPDPTASTRGVSRGARLGRVTHQHMGIIMQYVVHHWKSGKVVSSSEGVEADSPRNAIAASSQGIELCLRDWVYSDDADGAGSIADTDDEDHFIEALPQLDDQAS